MRYRRRGCGGFAIVVCPVVRVGIVGFVGGVVDFGLGPVVMM